MTWPIVSKALVKSTAASVVYMPTSHAQNNVVDKSNRTVSQEHPLINPR